MSDNKLTPDQKIHEIVKYLMQYLQTKDIKRLSKADKWIKQIIQSEDDPNRRKSWVEVGKAINALIKYPLQL
jgi:hypothetical protein